MDEFQLLFLNKTGIFAAETRKTVEIINILLRLKMTIKLLLKI